MGGLAFCVSMLWAQIFPFLALQLLKSNEITKDALTLFLVGSFVLWLVLNIAFFCTIDMSYLNSFIGTLTAPQYTCQLFQESETDPARFDAVFDNRISYIESIHVKEWVKNNIDRWQEEAPSWFKIEKIPDEFLPVEVLVAEGGANRTRSTVSLREIVKIPTVEPANQDGQERAIASPSGERAKQAFGVLRCYALCTG